jgi:hypothetical protein
VSLGGRSVTGVERAVSDNAGPKAGDGSAGANSNTTGNLAGARIGNSGSAQDGKIFGRSKGLRLSLDSESPRACQDEKNSGDKPKSK